MPPTSSTSPPAHDQIASQTLSPETMERLAMGCSICLDDLSLETSCLDMICLDRACNHVVQTKCKHMFHHQCISRWLDSRDIHSDGTCPYCRAVLVKAKPALLEWTGAATQDFEFVASYPNRSRIQQLMDRTRRMARGYVPEIQDNVREYVDQGTWAASAW
jgi:hypothetical protein